MTTMNRFEISNLSFDRELTAAGFTRQRRSYGYRQNGLSLISEENWPILRSRYRPESTDPLVDLIGRSGLWKCVTMEGRVIRIFEFPPQVIAGREIASFCDPAGESTPFERMLAWALETIDGRVPANWTPPTGEEVHAMIPGHELTVQSGTLIRRGDVVRENNRLALRFGILREVPEDLPDHRVQWLRRLLIDAQDRWRLVRVGFADGETGTGVHAEVDLTGVPHSLLRELVCVVLPALRFVVGWIAESALFLVNGSEEYRSLELDPRHFLKNIRKRKGGENGG